MFQDNEGKKAFTCKGCGDEVHCTGYTTPSSMGWDTIRLKTPGLDTYDCYYCVECLQLLANFVLSIPKNKAKTLVLIREPRG